MLYCLVVNCIAFAHSVLNRAHWNIVLVLHTKNRLQLNFDISTHQMAYKTELNGWQLYVLKLCPGLCLKKPIFDDDDLLFILL